MNDDKMRRDLKGLTPKGIDRFCTEAMGQKPGQGTRVAVRLFRKKVEDFDLMTDLNRPFREQLKRHALISRLMIDQRSASGDGTEKLLYRLDDGNTIEGVLIPGPGGRLTLCVSTQVGCASGCAFCRTGESGLTRNLSAAEIVNQVFAAQKVAASLITNIVLMGTGEPLSNYEAVKTFVQAATDRHGMGFSNRKVTISTCGLAPMIEKMADDTEMDASLAVSLNATTDAVRDQIMPVNKTYPIARLIQALHHYGRKTNKTVTIEYVLFRGVNDSDEDAVRLMELLKGLPCMINVLMFNSFPGAPFERPDEERVYAFRNMLLKHGFVAVVRNSRGKDINAACGQLRAAVT
ncbi:MAG: 23S rRNA (adenine(2503)-C(2))-methyltransferase [Nitrospirae bacterium GWC2_56_14]|nr:MAG: 23S rRNA (adenine(2503)-C(2))-methyltransferase [Nitrospirae bacterium GWC2_56_14]